MLASGRALRGTRMTHTTVAAISKRESSILAGHSHTRPDSGSSRWGHSYNGTIQKNENIWYSGLLFRRGILKTGIYQNGGYFEDAAISKTGSVLAPARGERITRIRLTPAEGADERA